MIVDPEEEYFPEEIDKLGKDVTEKGLSLIVAADWFNTTVMKKVKFYDENTRQWWMPDTGGANIPALNDLLKKWGIAFGDLVYEGDFLLSGKDMYYASGTSIVSFPKEGDLIKKALKDQGHEVIKGETRDGGEVAILGMLSGQDKKSGRIVVYGDSNCIDSAHMQKDCYWLFTELLDFATKGIKYSNLLSEISNSPELSIVLGNISDLKSSLPMDQPEVNSTQGLHRSLMGLPDDNSLPIRLSSKHFQKYSKVVLENETAESGNMSSKLNRAKSQYLELLPCLHLNWAIPIPLNKTAPSSTLYSHMKKLQSISLHHDKSFDLDYQESFAQHETKLSADIHKVAGINNESISARIFAQVVQVFLIILSNTLLSGRVIPTCLSLALLILVFICICNHHSKSSSRPKRRRGPRLRRLKHLVAKLPGV